MLPQVHRCVANIGSDFYTGVQAALITRSGNPIWVPFSLKGVSAAAPRSATPALGGLVGSVAGVTLWAWQLRCLTVCLFRQNPCQHAGIDA